jgi:DNA polymerase III sliding clamp (beta) subunit (PCNA family)
MIIRINSVEDLRNPVSRCKSAVNKGDGSNAIQSCILFQATEDDLTGRLRLTALDSRSHQLTLCVPEGAVDVQEAGEALVPYDYLSDLLSRLPQAQEITLEISGNNRMLVKCHPDEFEVFLHQADPEDFKLGMLQEKDIPQEVCILEAHALNQVITDSLAIILDQEDFKLVGEGIMLHGFSHDRGSNIVSRVTVQTQEQSEDWSVSVVGKLMKLINKYWTDMVTVHLNTYDSPVLVFKSNHDYFVVKQLTTDVDVSMLQEALSRESVGSFVVEGALFRSKAKLLDLAKTEVNIQISKNILKFFSSYASRGNNDVKVPILHLSDEQPNEKFSKDLLKRAISALEVSQIQGEWVPFDEENSNFFLRFVDADLPEYRQVVITPIQ